MRYMIVIKDRLIKSDRLIKRLIIHDIHFSMCCSQFKIYLICTIIYNKYAQIILWTLFLENKNVCVFFYFYFLALKNMKLLGIPLQIIKLN